MADMPSNATVKRMLNAFLATPHTWTASQNFAGGSGGAQILAADGTAVAPAFAYQSQPGMGWYRPSANIMAYAVSGTQYAQFNGNSFSLLRDNSFLAMGASADTVLSRTAPGKLSLTGTVPMIQFGGTTNGFAAWRSTSISAMDLKTADDSAFGTGRGSWQITGSLGNNGTGNFFYSTTAPTISSGFGTSPSIAASNGSCVFTVNVGTGGTATSGVIAMPAAANGWVAFVVNMTATAANRANVWTVQTGSATNSITVQSQTISTGAAVAWAASDILRIIAFAF